MILSKMKYCPGKSPKGPRSGPRARWRVQVFLPENYKNPGVPAKRSFVGDLPETSQMDLFAMFG